MDIYIYINGYKSKNSAKIFFFFFFFFFFLALFFEKNLKKILALFFDLYPFIFISQINLASFTGSSATGKMSRLVH